MAYHPTPQGQGPFRPPYFPYAAGRQRQQAFHPTNSGTARHRLDRIVVFAGFHASNLLASLRGLVVHITGLRRPFRVNPPRAFSLTNNFALKHFAASVHPNIYHATYYHPIDANLGLLRIVAVRDVMAVLYPLLSSIADSTPTRKLAGAEATAQVICISRNTENDLLRLPARLGSKTTLVHQGSGFRAQPASIRSAFFALLCLCGQLRRAQKCRPPL